MYFPDVLGTALMSIDPRTLTQILALDNQEASSAIPSKYKREKIKEF